MACQIYAFFLLLRLVAVGVNADAGRKVNHHVEMISATTPSFGDAPGGSEDIFDLDMLDCVEDGVSLMQRTVSVKTGIRQFAWTHALRVILSFLLLVPVLFTYWGGSTAIQTWGATWLPSTMSGLRGAVEFPAAALPQGRSLTSVNEQIFEGVSSAGVVEGIMRDVALDAPQATRLQTSASYIMKSPPKNTAATGETRLQGNESHVMTNSPKKTDAVRGEALDAILRDMGQENSGATRLQTRASFIMKSMPKHADTDGGKAVDTSLGDMVREASGSTRVQTNAVYIMKGSQKKAGVFRSEAFHDEAVKDIMRDVDEESASATRLQTKASYVMGSRPKISGTVRGEALDAIMHDMSQEASGATRLQTSASYDMGSRPKTIGTVRGEALDAIMRDMSQEASGATRLQTSASYDMKSNPEKSETIRGTTLDSILRDMEHEAYGATRVQTKSSYIMKEPRGGGNFPSLQDDANSK